MTIFEIYLKVGSNCYIQIEEFDSKPLVLRAYETYQKEYGPIQFYSSNMKRVALSELLRDEKATKRLVLSTSDGRYVVPSAIRRWSPIYAYFRNYLTFDLRPVRSTYKGKDIGGKIDFVLDFQHEDGTEEVILLQSRDWQLKIFRNFQLFKEALMSKGALEGFLKQELETGRLTCKKFTVLDMQEWRARAHSDYTGEIIQARGYSRFQYYILGRLATIRSERALRRQQPKPAPTAPEQPAPARPPTQAVLAQTVPNATSPPASTQPIAHGKTGQQRKAEQAAAGLVVAGAVSKVAAGDPIRTDVGGVENPTPTVDQASERHRQEAVAAQKGNAEPVTAPPAASLTPPATKVQSAETPKTN